MTPIVAPVSMVCGKADTMPGYTSDLVVRTDSEFTCMEDLQGSRFAFNDEMSLSGYECLRLWLHENRDERNLSFPFFKKSVRSGGHAKSIGLISQGLADCAVIDRNVMMMLAVSDPKLCSKVRILQDVDIGMMPAQPVVVANHTSPEVRQKLRGAFLALGDEESDRCVLDPILVSHYRPVEAKDYDHLAQRLQRCQGKRLLH